MRITHLHWLVSSCSAFVILLSSLSFNASPCFAGTWELQTPMTYNGSSSGTKNNLPTGGTWTDSGGNWSVISVGNSVTAKSSGSIQAKFKWKADITLPSDPPPSKVMIREEAKVSCTYPGTTGPNGSSTSGDGNCSLGSIPANIQNTKTATQAIKQGARIKAYSVSISGGDATITTDSGTLEATSSTPSSGGTCSAKFESYTVSISNVRLLRNSNPITSSNDKVLPGELIKLSVQGGDTTTTYSWGMPDNTPFKNYDMSINTNNAQLTPLNQTDMTLSIFNYYYTYGDNGEHEIKCTVKVNGQPISVEDKLMIIQPSYSFSGTAGSVPQSNNGPKLQGSGSYGQGMDWTTSTVKTDGGVNGYYCFIQTGQVTRNCYVPVSGDPTITDRYSPEPINSSGVDVRAPYFGLQFVVGTIVGVNPYGNTIDFGDSPGESTIGKIIRPGQTEYEFANFTKVEVSDTFQTWLMFMPAADGSCYVPLSKVEWHWEATWTKNAVTGNWNGQSTPPTSPTGSDNHVHPVWSGVIDISKPYKKNGTGN